MANPSRKMVTIRRIDRVDPIEGADRIEVATVGGWRVVVKKGEFHAGDLGLYHEIDSFIDTSRPEYAFLDATREMVVDGKTRVGHVLRTRKMRGVYSQGLLLDPHKLLDLPEQVLVDLCESKSDMSEACGVVEYYKPMPLGAKDFIGRYDPWVAPRTDAERCQNIDLETWDIIKRSQYEVSVKVDGTSITMVYEDRYNDLCIYSHNNRFSLDRGMGKLVYDTAKTQGLVDFCEANHNVTLQMEMCGPKIQGDRLRLGKHRLFVFSVWDMRHADYISWCGFDGFDHGDRVQDSHVPVIDTGSMLDQFDTPSDFIGYVDGIKDNVTKGCLDEGLVVHVYDAPSSDEWMRLRNALGQTMQCKAVSNKYLLKAKE